MNSYPKGEDEDFDAIDPAKQRAALVILLQEDECMNKREYARMPLCACRLVVKPRESVMSGVRACLMSRTWSFDFKILQVRSKVKTGWDAQCCNEPCCRFASGLRKARTCGALVGPSGFIALGPPWRASPWKEKITQWRARPIPGCLMMIWQGPIDKGVVHLVVVAWHVFC